MRIRVLYEMLGYSEGELEGIDHWLIYHPDYQETVRETAMARMRGEDSGPTSTKSSCSERTAHTLTEK